jgi:hypothetical protein
MKVTRVLSHNSREYVVKYNRNARVMSFVMSLTLDFLISHFGLNFIDSTNIFENRVSTRLLINTYFGESL